jgi:hypothetical protein
MKSAARAAFTFRERAESEKPVTVQNPVRETLRHQSLRDRHLAPGLSDVRANGTATDRVADIRESPQQLAQLQSARGGPAGVGLQRGVGVEVLDRFFEAVAPG